MRRFSLFVVVTLSLASGLAQANGRYQSMPQSNNGVNTDVVVDMPPEAWTQAERRQPGCLRCCIFENRNYTEGAVVKSEGVLLQCARDEHSLGTNNLIWKIVK
ncbi:YnjH family protein [Pantoea sp.]|uniref:YnjH family protein n=1 Tax=Pantoea sp. TaxID=69393 RepID=UPI0028A5AB5E|nr:YnjH family protein [Pantoea sp.]